jgi:hypothetical protein
VQKQTTSLLLYLPVLLMSSCAIRSRPIATIPDIGERTEFELYLSDIAWDHARCYLNAKPDDVNGVEATIATCKKLLLTKLGDKKELKALRDYIESSYPTAADALVGAGICSPCQSRSFHDLKNIGYPQREVTAQDSSGSQAARLYDWIALKVAKLLDFRPGGPRLLIQLAVSARDMDNNEKKFAVVDITYKDGMLVGSITTPGSLTLYRGEYFYKVALHRYKSFDSAPRILDVGTGDSNEKGMSCTLVLEASTWPPLPCNITEAMSGNSSSAKPGT